MRIAAALATDQTVMFLPFVVLRPVCVGDCFVSNFDECRAVWLAQTCHRPRNTGRRFSLNAATASR